MTQPTEWEKIFANHIFDNGVDIQNVFKNLYNSKNQILK